MSKIGDESIAKEVQFISPDVSEAMDLVDKLVNDVFKCDFWFVDNQSCKLKMFKGTELRNWYEIHADGRRKDKSNRQSQTYALCAAGSDIKHTKSIICNLFRMLDSCKTIKVVEYTSWNSVKSFSKDSDEMQCFIFDCALRGIDLEEIMKNG